MQVVYARDNNCEKAWSAILGASLLGPNVNLLHLRVPVLLLRTTCRHEEHVKSFWIFCVCNGQNASRAGGDGKRRHHKQAKLREGKLLCTCPKEGRPWTAVCSWPGNPENVGDTQQSSNSLLPSPNYSAKERLCCPLGTFACRVGTNSHFLIAADYFCSSLLLCLSNLVATHAILCWFSCSYWSLVLGTYLGSPFSSWCVDLSLWFNGRWSTVLRQCIVLVYLSLFLLLLPSQFKSLH